MAGTARRLSRFLRRIVHRTSSRARPDAAHGLVDEWSLSECSIAPALPGAAIIRLDSAAVWALLPAIETQPRCCH